MAYSRRLGVIGILGVCFFVAVGCDDSDDKKANEADAGEGGENSTAGSGGKAQGGSQNNAGKGGTATAGSAGSSAAGAGGTSAGEGGGAGEGGSAGDGLGGMGGEGNSSPIGGEGGGGGASAGGAGGAAPTIQGLCAASCQIDDDCKVDGDATEKCDPVTHHCVYPGTACETHDECVLAISAWEPCGVDSNCVDGFTCINWNGSPYCAQNPDPDPEVGCFPLDLITAPIFGGNGDAQICGMAAARCGGNGECFLGCGAFGCADGTCDDESGICKCSTNEECTLGVCGDDSLCAECVTSEHCANNGGNDVCIDGKCGCDGNSTCPDGGYDNAPAVCE